MKRLLLTIACAAILAGCLKTRAEIDAENTAVAQQTHTVAQQRAAVQDRTQERPQPAGYHSEEYDEAVRALSGRVDSLENYVQQQNAAKEAEATNKDKQLHDAKFQAYEEELKKLALQVAALSEELMRLKAPPVEPPVAKGKGPYDQGEQLFGSKKWKEAIVNFQKYRDLNPKGKMYADATYKIGVCFQELGMKDEARSFLEEVTAKHPQSKEAKKAQIRLKTLK